MTGAPVPPEFSPAVAFFGLLLLGFLAASLSAWIWFLVDLKKIRKWSGWKWDHPASSIGLIDVVAFFCCILISQVVAVVAVRLFLAGDAFRQLTVPSPDASGGAQGANAANVPAWVAPVLSLSYLVALALAIGWITLRSGATLRQLGITSSERKQDVQVGFLSFLLITPVVLVFSGLVNSVTNVEYQHPVINAMREHPWTFPLLFFGAVVCAPLWEEFAFRGLLIRWLDSIRSSGGDMHVIFFGRNSLSASIAADSDVPGINYQDVDGNPYASPIIAPSQEPESLIDLRSSEGLEVYPPWWPAIASGIAFGLAHFAYGISWLPLIFLGTILGRIFQLRRSVLPCVVIHACFNALSMLGLASQIFSGK
jgi:membrane protease YdiL (CAAX protease family)